MCVEVSSLYDYSLGVFLYPVTVRDSFTSSFQLSLCCVLGSRDCCVKGLEFDIMTLVSSGCARL